MNHARFIKRNGDFPITLEKARQYLNIIPYEGRGPDEALGHPDDPVIQDCIAEACAVCETYTGRALANNSYQLYVNGLDCPIRLPFAAPLIEVESVEYLDPAGAWQALDPATYVALAHLQPAMIDRAVPYVGLPPRKVVAGNIRISYKAGPTDELPVPDDILRAMKQIMADMFENREDTTPLSLRNVPRSARWLMNQYRLYKDGAV